MATEFDAFEESADQGQLLDWSHKRDLRAIFSTQASRAYLYLSLGMGLLAFALPIVLVAAGGYDGNYSISYFYHVNDLSRNIFVGTLCAVGVFLFLFQGLSRWENWTLNVAGIAAISVAMNPMSEDQQCDAGGSWVHGGSAILFFVCLAIVAIFFSKTRIQYIIHPPKRLRFKRAYEGAGIAMIGMPAAVAAAHFIGGARCDEPWIFWIETFGIWAFAFYWFVKTTEYKTLLGVQWTASTREIKKTEALRAKATQ